MPFVTKLLVSFAAVALLLAVLAIRKVDAGERSAGSWRGGRHDLLRRMIAHPDGTPRRGMRLALVLWFGAWLAVLWLFA